MGGHPRPPSLGPFDLDAIRRRAGSGDDHYDTQELASAESHHESDALIGLTEHLGQDPQDAVGDQERTGQDTSSPGYPPDRDEHQKQDRSIRQRLEQLRRVVGRQLGNDRVDDDGITGAKRLDDTR